jgi:hypothetical protein
VEVEVLDKPGVAVGVGVRCNGNGGALEEEDLREDGGLLLAGRSPASPARA